MINPQGSQEDTVMDKKKRKKSSKQHSFRNLFKREKDAWKGTLNEMSGFVRAQDVIVDEFHRGMKEDLSALDKKRDAAIRSVLKNALIIVSVFSAFCFIYGLIGPAVVQGTSMEPSYSSGQLVMVNKTGVPEVKRGDVILFKQDGNVLIKRVIAVGGETIYAEGGTVYINDIGLKEDYVSGGTEDIEKTLVEENSYYVMGDNRSSSVDSRTFGSVSKKDMIGVVIGGRND